MGDWTRFFLTGNSAYLLARGRLPYVRTMRLRRLVSGGAPNERSGLGEREKPTAWNPFRMG